LIPVFSSPATGIEYIAHWERDFEEAQQLQNYAYDECFPETAPGPIEKGPPSYWWAFLLPKHL